jgi:hypothetical protein
MPQPKLLPRWNNRRAHGEPVWEPFATYLMDPRLCGGGGERH